MELKNFALGRYHDRGFVLKSVERREYAFLTSYQQFLFKILNEQKHPLFALFQPVGVGTAGHFKSGFELLKKLVDLGLPATLKRSETKEPSKLVAALEPSKFEGMYAPAAFIFGLFCKMVARFTSRLWLVSIGLIACFGLAAYASFYEIVAASDIQFGFPFLRAIFWGYVGVSLSLSWRSLLRAAFIRSQGRELYRERFEFWGPFLCLAVDGKDIWLEGIRARASLAFLGAIAPLSLAGIFSLFSVMGNTTVLSSILLSFPCLVTSLLMICPLHQGADGAELLHCLFSPDQLEEKIVEEIYRPQVYAKASRVAIFILAISLWTLVWTDIWRSFLGLSLATYVDHIYFNVDPGMVFFVRLTLQSLYLIIAYPFILLLYHVVQTLVVLKQEPDQKQLVNRQPLTFQEQSAALSKVALFVSLSETDSTELFKQMETRFFAHGKILVKQGDVGDEFFILVRGKAYASFRDSRGQKNIVGHLQEGDAFGEVALIDEVPRTASIISDGGCYAVSLKKEIFQSFVSKTSSPDSVKQMIRLSSFFKRHPLFLRLDAKDLAQLIESLHYESLAPREQISEQALQENFYIVYAGRVRVDTGDDRTDFLLGPEDCFGFSPMSPTGVQGKVIGVDGGGLLRLPKEAFLKFVWDQVLNHEELLWLR